MKCDYCLNARTIVSENGFHSACCLPNDKDILNCLTGKEDRYIRNPMKKLTLLKVNAEALYNINQIAAITEP